MAQRPAHSFVWSNAFQQEWSSFVRASMARVFSCSAPIATGISRRDSSSPAKTPSRRPCARRHEEAGLTDLAFEWGTEFVETEPYARNKIARYYLARTHMERVILKVNPELGRPEHHEYRWVDLTEAFALTVPRLQRVIAWAASRVIRPAQLA